MWCWKSLFMKASFIWQHCEHLIQGDWNFRYLLVFIFKSTVNLLNYWNFLLVRKDLMFRLFLVIYLKKQFDPDTEFKLNFLFLSFKATNFVQTDRNPPDCSFCCSYGAKIRGCLCPTLLYCCSVTWQSSFGSQLNWCVYSC